MSNQNDKKTYTYSRSSENNSYSVNVEQKIHDGTYEFRMQMSGSYPGGNSSRAGEMPRTPLKKEYVSSTSAPFGSPSSIRSHSSYLTATEGTPPTPPPTPRSSEYAPDSTKQP